MKKFLLILLTLTLLAVSIVSPSVYAVDTPLTDEYQAETTPDPMEDLPGNGMISTEDQPLDIFKPTTPTLVVENGQDFETVLMSLTDSSLTGADIAPGVYRIKNVYSSLYVDIHGPSMLAGALIHQWTFHTDTTELWEIEPYSLNSNYYTIRSLYSNLYLGVTATSINTDNVVQTVVADPDGIAHTDATLWRIYENDSGQFALFPKSGESYMNVLTAPSTSNGDELIQTEYTDDNAKYWCIESLATISNGEYSLRNEHYSDFLNVQTDGSIELNEKAKIDSSKWNINYLNDGYYKIESVFSGKALTAPSSLDASITESTFSETNDNQRWMVTYIETTGRYHITSKSNYAWYLATGDQTGTSQPNVEIRSSQSDGKDEWVIFKPDAVTLIPKEQLRWCWIAAASMASLIHGELKYSQNEVAWAVITDKDPDRPKNDPGPYDRPALPLTMVEEALEFLLDGKFDCTTIEGRIYSEIQLRELLDRGVPIIINRQAYDLIDREISAHALVIYDYYYDSYRAQYKYNIYNPDPEDIGAAEVKTYSEICLETSALGKKVWEDVIVYSDGNYTNTIPS